MRVVIIVMQVFSAVPNIATYILTFGSATKKETTEVD